MSICVCRNPNRQDWNHGKNVCYKKELKMKRAKKMKRKLASRQLDYDNGVGKKDAKAYRRPGSQK